MNIILYLLQLIQYQHKQICWLLNFICRYIPLKQWAFDDSHSPKYQKFKIDKLPLFTDYRQDWTYKDLIPYYEKRYGKKIRDSHKPLWQRCQSFPMRQWSDSSFKPDNIWTKPWEKSIWTTKIVWKHNLLYWRSFKRWSLIRCSGEGILYQ